MNPNVERILHILGSISLTKSEALHIISKTITRVRER